MKRIIKTPSIIIVLLIIGITNITFFHPMKKELENSYMRNFRLLSESKVHSIYTYIEKSLDSAESLSSRTVIRSKILDYKNGDISIDELRQYIKPRYEDGVKALDDLLGAYRVVDGEIIVEHGKSNTDIDLEKAVTLLDYDISTNDDDVHLIVYSPIIEDEHYLGYDIVCFNKSDIVKELTSEEIKIEFISKEDLKEIVKQDAISKIDDKLMLIDIDEDIGYVTKLDKTDRYIHIYTQEETLFRPVRRTAAIGHTALVFGLLVLFITINYVVTKNVDKILTDVENSRDQYKEHAFKDSLTGVHSRLFLDTWIKDNLEELNEQDAIYSVAMIDGDNFKEINDNYGHFTGDKVLTKIAEILKKSIRQKDIVIRYGGDEFLIIFKNCNSETAHSILERVEDKLEEIKEFDFNITISYGISEIRNSEDFFDALNKADEKMYCFKHNKNSSINQTGNI